MIRRNSTFQTKISLEVGIHNSYNSYHKLEQRNAICYPAKRLGLQAKNSSETLENLHRIAENPGFPAKR